MSNKFQGEADELKTLIARRGVQGEWIEKTGCLTYRARTGAIFNWYSSTGTYNFQGAETTDFQSKIVAAIENANGLPVVPLETKTKILAFPFHAFGVYLYGVRVHPL
jgi:hypothetical protein